MTITLAKRRSLLYKRYIYEFRLSRKLSTVTTPDESNSLQRNTKVRSFREHVDHMKAVKSVYVSEFEKDSCGVGLLANMKGIPNRKVVTQANQMLSRMAHRGGCGCEPNTGDGAGMLLGLPHNFFKTVLSRDLNISNPLEEDNYAVGMVFFSVDPEQNEICKKIFERKANDFGMKVLGWRSVPTNNSNLGRTAKLSEPLIEQVFVTNSSKGKLDTKMYELELLRLRNLVSSDIEKANLKDFYICSLSSKTVTYKGQLTPEQLEEYFLDMHDKDFATHMAIVHSRFSTNTFPSWDRAQPNRMLCHNGEINTLRGNKNWMQARSKKMLSPYKSIYSDGDSQLDDASLRNIGLLPVCSDNMTDSGNFDSVLEMITRASDRSVSETMMMLIPEAWQNNKHMSPSKKAFYQFNSCLMEPWDGPAMMAFSDGNQLGAVLDRNGLRPSRFYVTNDDHVILSSEIGVLPDLDPASVKVKGRLEPGKMFLVDFKKGGLVHDEELKLEISSKRDYKTWVDNNLLSLSDIAATQKDDKSSVVQKLSNEETLRRHLNTFGHTTESLEMITMPMAAQGKEPLGSMGIDIPLAVLSVFPRQLSEYFKQLFAQVTNPPIDPIREEIVMSLKCPVGPEGNLLDMSPEHCARLLIDHPVIDEHTFSLLKNNKIGARWKSAVIDCTVDASKLSDGEELKSKLEVINSQVQKAISENKANIIILSQRNISKTRAPVPSLMSTGSVNHFLIENGLRTNVALVVDSGDAKEVHDFCTLVGFGADAICPFMSFEAIRHLNNNGDGRLKALSKISLTDSEAIYNYIKSVDKGLLKVMAKMGISTLQSYKSAQIFEAVGLDSEVTNQCFRGTTSRIEGAGFESLSMDVHKFHSAGFGDSDRVPLIRNVGDFHYRHGGEAHQNDPRSMSELQVAVRKFDQNAWNLYSKYSQEQNQKVSLRGLLDLKFDTNKRIALDEVEPASEIIKRFVTGAMSLGSISAEAHETLAIAMNRIGARSNTGEGGEDPVRFLPLPNGDLKRSAIKQVASGRFGVTAEYLANSDQIQIKMAQGAKPGEGGELPGYKVSGEIAKVRGTTPGVGLISPPPHHDIYSIEDLAQLVFDLKNSNPEGTVSVKLVSEVGVGIVAAGVAKTKADHIVISGGDGGTGAAAWTGVHHAGLPWELGVAEAQQTLLVSNLRNRIRLQADGQMKTGRDIIIAALLGAEEFGFSTAPLIAIGCIMMRKCHLNTCPVGIATQDPELRAKFKGLPEHVVNFFMFLSEEVRQYMAMLGIRRFQDLIGRAELLDVRADLQHYKTKTLDLTPLLVSGKDLNPEAIPYNNMAQDHQLEAVLDHTLIARSQPALQDGTPVFIEHTCTNANRSLGTMLSNKVVKIYGSRGLPDDTINIKLKGSAGQSLGFVLMKGITLELEGDANDSVGKGLCGGKLIVYPHKELLRTKEFDFKAEDNVIIGNVALYGATAGEAYFRGKAGERFCVRNSGAKCVVEGVGDHGCEYMTGGRVIVLGSTGRNFAAGMSGGIAYVYDPRSEFDAQGKINKEMIGLERIEEEGEMDEVLEMIEKHRRYTGSKLAVNIISNWEENVKKFVKIMPHDYKLALSEKRKKEEVESFDEVVSKVAVL